jgi:hypothetical protein
MPPLHIRDVPVFYIPYFNFPIDDRRQTGLLTPRFGNTNDGGFDFAQPIYLNLAPQYDATLTPRLLTERGAMLETEFRYLLPYGGTGSLQGSLLPNDSLYAGRDRKSAAWQHSGELSYVCQYPHRCELCIRQRVFHGPRHRPEPKQYHASGARGRHQLASGYVEFARAGAGLPNDRPQHHRRTQALCSLASVVAHRRRAGRTGTGAAPEHRANVVSAQD